MFLELCIGDSNFKQLKSFYEIKRISSHIGHMNFKYSRKIYRIHGMWMNFRPLHLIILGPWHSAQIITLYYFINYKIEMFFFTIIL